MRSHMSLKRDLRDCGQPAEAVLFGEKKRQMPQILSFAKRFLCKGGSSEQKVKQAAVFENIFKQQVFERSFCLPRSEPYGGPLL